MSVLVPDSGRLASARRSARRMRAAAERFGLPPETAGEVSVEHCVDAYAAFTEIRVLCSGLPAFDECRERISDANSLLAWRALMVEAGVFQPAPDSGGDGAGLRVEALGERAEVADLVVCDDAAFSG